MEITGKIFIIFNQDKKGSDIMAEEIYLFLKEKSIDAEVLNIDKIDENFEARGCILVITLGGDGTVLKCARIFSRDSIPILAVNFGEIGFITEVEKCEWKEAVGDFLDGIYDIKAHLMLNVKVFRDNKLVFEKTGLNDGVISAGNIAKIVKLVVYVDNTEIGEYRADGIIISTATGSTAYSAAAGGPLLYPDMDALLLTPICPYSLSSRAIVFPADKDITVEVKREQRANLYLTVDGQEVFPVEKGDIIKYRKGDYRTLILKSRENHFFKKVKTKLNWSGGPNG